MVQSQRSILIYKFARNRLGISCYDRSLFSWNGASPLHNSHCLSGSGSWQKASTTSSDIFSFIFEGSILLMGSNLNDPETFLRLWSALLLVDMIWSIIVWTIQRGLRPTWVRNNLIWLIAAWSVWGALEWVLAKAGIKDSDQLAFLSCVFALMEIGRSFTDYALNWDFYFPDQHRRPNT